MSAKQKLICSIMIISLFLSVMPTLPISAKEQGATKKTAKAIEANKNYEGTLYYSESTWYKYKVKETGYIVINIDAKDFNDVINFLAYWTAKIFVDNKEVLYEVTDYQLQSVRLGLKKGTVVYIQILGNNNNNDIPYLLSVKNTKSTSWECEINDTKSMANTIKSNKKYYGNSYYGYPASGSEKDYFKFKVTKNGPLDIYFGSIDLLNDTCNFSLKVYVKSQKKASIYSKDFFTKVKTTDVKKGDIVYFLASSTESYSDYIDYSLMVKYK